MLPLLLFAGLLLAVVHFPASASSSFSSSPHIAELNVLLPPLMTNPVEYRLQGSDGCFTWSWDHHDILSVQPEYNGSSRCSTSARFISIAPYSGRKETAVYATDIMSGTVIRCEVFIDKISRIQIFHHSVKLDLHGLATLRVRAFDEEENVFTSLVGLQFLWRFMPKPTEPGQVVHRLVHVPLKETPLSDCSGFCGDLNTQIKLEDRGVGSDLCVVKGIEIGHEIVSVRLLEQQLEHVEDEIVLTVAEAISLYPPSPVFVIVGAAVQYSVKVIHQNKPQVMVLPSPFYRWSVTNSTVARVDSKMGLAHAMKLGVTSVIVEDVRLEGHLQISSMHVVLPDKLQLYIVPVTSSCDPVEGAKPTPSSVLWHITSGGQYVIYMKVFSSGPHAQEIYITEKDNFKLQSNSAHWNTFLVPDDISAKHGWRVSRLIEATSQGLGSFVASLRYYGEDTEESEVLEVVQEIMVCNSVKISMGETIERSGIIHLPWAPGISQEFELTAIGGCAKVSKDYNWLSSNLATVSVSAAGIIRANRLGQAIIKVSTVFDPINSDEVAVEVSMPSSMVMLKTFPVEAVVGTRLQAAVTMRASSGDYFSRCDAFSSFVRWEVLSGSDCFKIVNTTKEEWGFDLLLQSMQSKSLSPCGWVSLYASGAGRAMLHATLSKDLQSSDHSLSGRIILKASSNIAAYLPLVVRQAGNGNQFGGYWVDLARTEFGFPGLVSEGLDELFLVPGTGIDVFLLGGPERWDQDVEFIETAQTFHEDRKPLKDGAVVRQSPSGGKLYRISCQTLGHFKVVFARGNLAGDDHPLPEIANVELPLICAFPSSITMIANEPASRTDLIWSATQADRDPGRIRISPVTVANGCTIRIAAVGIHSSGRAFGNSSSLSLRWELSGCEELAYWKDSDSSESLQSSWERFLVLQNATGLCIVRAVVEGVLVTHVGHLFKEFHPQPGSSENVLTDAIRLQLVSSLRVIPESILLFFHPDAKVNISVTGGTCYLDAVANDTQVVEVIQLPSSTQCSSLLLGVRGLGISLVTVRDIGLSPPTIASALVRVADVDWIKIISEGVVRLMAGSSEYIDILAGIDDGSVFHSSQYAYMDIHVHLDDGILELVNKEGLSVIGRGEIHDKKILIRAMHLGVTTLYVSVRQQSGGEIFSQVITVEVYAPPRMHPEYVFLAPGASYVLAVRGGPKLGVVVEYASADDATATIHRSSGKVSAIDMGNTIVHASFYGENGMVICEASGKVKVGIPLSMTLNLQSKQLAVGREMPIFPWFLEGNLFSFYELCNNYKWTIEDEQVLGFQMARFSYSNDDHEVPFPSAMEKGISAYSDTEDPGFIKVLYGRSAGRTKVSVSFSCDFIRSGSVSQLMSYNASESISVISALPLALGVPITWVLPPFYTSSELLPTSSESYGEWDSLGRERNIIYSLLRTCGGKNEYLHQDAIVIDNGRIRTKESNNLGCIQAKDRVTGITEVACCVRVAEVVQVRVSMKEFPGHLAEIAVGDNLELFVNYQDALGNPFYEAHGVVPLEVETNYPDLLSIQTLEENSTHYIKRKVHVQAMRHGRALVRVSINKSPMSADYILISVGAHLRPQNPVLHVGDYVNFSIIGEGGRDLVSGRWLSENGSVICINEFSGEAHAVNEGSTRVLFEDSNWKLQTAVTVQRVGLVFVDAPAETLTNVPFPAKGYHFLVRFSDSYGHKFGATGSSLGLYDCKVDPPFVGYAKPWRDLETDKSFCLFFPHSPEHLSRAVPKRKSQESKSSDSEGLVYVSIIASLKEAPQVMGSGHAPFVGGFSVLEMAKMNLTPNLNKSLITIVGNTDVEIHWHAKDLMLVSCCLRRDDFGIAGRAEYEVKILRSEKFADKIIITLPVIGQSVEIDVSYVTGEGTTSTMTSGVIWAALLGCTVVFAVIVFIFIRLLNRPERPRQSAPAVPAVGSPSTPDRRLDSNLQQTPRTPQPFVEYVKRTIDETPYYRRGRRRFDPQHTY